MKINKPLAAIFMLSLAFNLFFALQTEHFSDDASYFVLRQVDHISETNKPMMFDKLSYGGRQVIGSPLFYYIATLFSVVPIGLKILPAIALSFTPVISYLIATKITKDNLAALFASFMSAFIPATFVVTLNRLSVYSIMLPLLMLMIYFIMDIKNKLNKLIVMSFIIPLMHPTAFLLSISFLFYMIIMLSEQLGLDRQWKEAMIFSIFLTALIEFIIYRNAFSSLGFSIIFQNIPEGISSRYFASIDILNAVIISGVAPFILGVSGIIIGIFKERDHNVILLSGFILSSLLLLAIGLIRINIGLMFLGTTLAVASSLSLEKLFKYIQLTKLAQHDTLIKLVTFTFIGLTLIVPSWMNADKNIANAVNNEEVNFLTGFRKELDANSTILADVDEAHLVTFVTGAKNVMDSNFLYIPGIDQRFNDIGDIYTTSSGKKALQLLKKYGTDYIYFSGKTKQLYNIERLRYIAEDDTCFRKVKASERFEAYKVRC